MKKFIKRIWGCYPVLFIYNIDGVVCVLFSVIQMGIQNNIDEQCDATKCIPACRMTRHRAGPVPPWTKSIT
jgi:hypothetical protein